MTCHHITPQENRQADASTGKGSPPLTLIPEPDMEPQAGTKEHS